MATSPSKPRRDSSHHHHTHGEHHNHVETGSSSRQTPRSGRTQSWGLWHDAEWWCNCKPRRQAVQCQATRNNINKGKHYWRCQLTKGCGFFLWAEEARLREMAMALPSSSNDAAAADCSPATTKALTQQQITSYGVYARTTRSQTKHETGGLRSKPLYPILPSAEDFPGLLETTPATTRSAAAAAKGKTKTKAKAKAAEAEADPASTLPLSFDQSLPSPAPTASLKRNRDLFAQDYLSDLNSDEERELVDMTNRSAEGVKRARSPFMGVFGAHKGTRTPDRILNKPKQSVARKLFQKRDHDAAAPKVGAICDAPDPKRRKTSSFIEDQAQMKQRRTVFFSDSPKEQRKTVSFREPSGGFLSQRDKLQGIDLTSFPSPDPASDMDSPRRPSDLQAKIIGLLRDQGVDASVLASVRKLLAASARHADTIAMERDTFKAVLKQKTTETDELKKQIVVMKEQERKMKTQITNMKADLMKIYHEN